MKKAKVSFLGLLIGLFILLVGGVLLAPISQNTATVAHAEILSSSGFTPSRNKNEEIVYHLFRKQTYELTPGTQIMYVAGSDLANTMVVPEIPAGSAKLTVTASGKAYQTNNITCYVDVVERGNGFDGCPCGTLNENATEYNCCYGGIQHYKGAPFNYSEKIYYNSARVGVFQNNVAITNATVQLFDGEKYFPLNSEGNGYYSHTQVYNGEYEIIVNGEHTGQPLVINKFTIGEEGRLDGNIFYSGNTYTENVYFYTMQVKTYLDGELSNKPGNVYLKSAKTNCALTEKSTGVYGIRYIMRESSVRENYSVIIGGRDTGYVLSDFTDGSFKNDVSIYYYTLSVTINADTDWNDAKVELRNDDGEIRSVLKYQSSVGTSALYTNIMQKDEAVSPEKMTVFVDYISTDEDIYSVRSGAIGAIGDETFAEVTYYDVNVNLRLDNNPFTFTYPVTISNGVNSYSLVNSTGILSLRVRKIMSGSEELPYKVVVSGVTDNLVPLTLTQTNKTVTYDYYTVDFYTYKISGTTFVVTPYRTQYVRKGSVPSLVSDAYVTGMTFDKWSLSTWSESEDLDSIVEYDFSNVITGPVALYPHFAKTEVKINESFVKCAVSGAQDSNGVAFRMANVTVSGFEKGNNSIKSFLLNLKNVERVYFYSTSGKTYKQGQNANLSTVSGGFYSTNSAVSVTFNNKVSMSEAQDYIRNYVVIKPVVNQDVEVTLTVSDGVLSTSATTSVTQSQWGGTKWTVKSAGTYSSWWIGSNKSIQYVYFTGNCTFNGNSSGWGGLEIYGTCYLYIPSGITITCNGVAGNGRTPGGAGVYISSGSNLYVFGNGSLVANGGKAGNGSNGAGGGGGWKSGSTYYSGGGGAGGAGGGGAGAGIGGHGAYGGTGGSGGAGGSVGWSSKGKAQFWGQAGAGGNAGGTPDGCGNIYVTSTITINAKGGAKGSNGNGGGAGGYQTDAGTGWKYNHCAAGGGGGGGGGAGYAANNIGTGGAGGGGGGGGGSGACDYHSSTSYNCIGGGKGGTGGYGASGQAGRGGNAHCDHQDVPGGNGGGAGSGGNGGSAKSTTSFSVSTSSNTKWTVTFQGATSNATQEYAFESTTITVPDYVPTGKNLFLGWKVATYGCNANGTSASKPLTTAESVLYQPGTTIKTALGTYGNIVLKPVTMPYEGKIAQDTLNVAKKYFASTSPTTPTYYTYAIQAYLDGVKSDVGTMVFTINGKNYKVESSAVNAGLYSLTLETNVATFTAKLNGNSISATLNKGTNNVYFESMKVVVTGHNDLQSVILSGSDVPVLQKDTVASSEFYCVFTSVKQQGEDTNTYTIVINGETIPNETAVAKFGTTATIDYCTVDVDLKTNMAIENVELVDADKNSVALKYVNGVWTGVALLDTETTYTVYANGFNTKVDAKLNSDHVSLIAKIYEFKLVTRINGVVSSSVAKLTVNGKNTTMKTGAVSFTKSAPSSNEYWSYVVVNDDAVTIEANGTEVTTVTPSEELGNTYIDYFTVQYDAGEATGSVPVDDNIYLAGQDVTILSFDHLSTGSNDKYLAGWTAGGNNYTEGDVATINSPLTLTAVVTNDLLKVHYVDYFGELEVKSRLELTDRLVAYDGDKMIAEFNDYGRSYKLKGWVLDIDGTKTVYTSGQLTDFIAGDILGDSTEEVNVYFTAVYEVGYLNGIHFELELENEDSAGQKVLGHIGEKFTVNYRVTINDGVSAILLIPQFNKNVFKIADVTVNNETVLGEATLTKNLNSDVFKIAFESTDLYKVTGDILITVEYEIINNVAGKYNDFGFVLDYPTDMTVKVNSETGKITDKSLDVDNNTRSNAWYILGEQGLSAIHNEVKIYVDNEIAIIIQAEGSIVIDEQTVIYHAESLTAGNVYSRATAFDSEATYYEFIDGEFIINENVTASNFSDKYYYVLNSVDDVLYEYSGFGQQVLCVNPAVFTVKWYTYDNETFTEIDAPKNVGDYYIGVSATASDYVYSVNEVKGLVHIVKANVTYTIDDKTSVWSEEIVALTGSVTDGTVYGDDNLNIVLSTVATSESDAGNYAITGTFDNGNYNVTIVNGNYAITKKQVELGLDATAKFIGNSFAYDGTEKTISVTIANFYQDILSVSYTGGEDGCQGNGAVHVIYNENNEVTGYTITALFTINNAYVQNCEFVKDGNNNSINTLSAVLTITINGITKAQFEELISQFVEFSVVDGATNHVLVPVDNAMAYDKGYDAISEYAKVVVLLEKNNVTNDKISAIVTYKLNSLESVEFNAASDFNYSAYTVKNAGVYIVNITFVAGSGYAFEAEVNPVYTVTMTIEKKALTINASADVAYNDEAPEITIDGGTNGWIEGESYSTYDIDDIQHYSYLVHTSYVCGDNAGTSYTLEWVSSDVLSELLYNYDITFTTTDGNTVNKKVINILEYAFNGYTAIYDGEEHELYVVRNDEKLTDEDALVSFSIETGSVAKNIVKNVIDSGDFVATVTLKDTNNYVFGVIEIINYEENEDENPIQNQIEIVTWDLNEANTVATLMRQVSIVPKSLHVEVNYNTKATATLSLTGFVNGEDESVLTDFTYLSGETPIGNSITATVAGEFVISAESSNKNYGFTIYTVSVYEVSFVTGYYDASVAGNGFVPQNMPVSQFVFSGLDADTFDVAEVTGTFTANLPDEIPTLRHYTFNLWSGESNSAVAFNFAESIIQSNVTIYAIWQKNATYTLTYMYKIDKQETWNELAVDTLYVDDKLVYGDTLRSLSGINWFVGDVWYFDTDLQTKVLNKIFLNEDTVVYGKFRFDIGVGDVNADGNVNANDITLYRQWIVGGYQMIVVEDGNEWSTVTDEAFDIHNTYFLKRVADANAQTSSAVVLGDNALDIRDVSTIRMALVGGYGVDIATGVETSKDSLVIVSVSEIDNVSKLLTAIGSGKKAKLSKDINESVSIIDISNMQKDIIIDLNGKTITVPSFSIALSSAFDGKIEICNGSIVANGGISLLAPSGTIILKNVTMFDENGEFSLAAANQSLHFVGLVEFYKDNYGTPVPASVTIPSSTHIVIEEETSIVIERIDVEQVAGYVLSIDLVSDEVEELLIDGQFEISGDTNEVVKQAFIEVATKEDFIAAASQTGIKAIRLTSDLCDLGKVSFADFFTIDGNGFTVSGNSAFNLNVKGAEISNVKFKNIHDSNCQLSAIYGSALSGTVKIANCEFDTFDWDAIQITPVAGANIAVINNVFKHSGENAVNTKRYVHVQSAVNVDFGATITDNKFYNVEYLNEAAIEVYYPTNENKVVISDNVIESYISVCILTNNGTNAWGLAKNFADESDKNVVCAIIGTYNVYLFTSIQDAVDFAVTTPTTVTLIGNSNGNGVIVSENQNIIFDFNGYTYVLDGTTVGSTGTETNGFQLLKGATVTFKNGTLKTVTAKILIQNYATTTLDNFTVSGEDAASLLYVASNNFGSLTVSNGSKIMAYGEQVAFDLWYGLNTAYDDGITVTLKSGTQVVGKVEYGAQRQVAGWTEKAKLIVEDGAVWDRVITLTTNIKLTKTWVFDFDCTLDLNGKTISNDVIIWDDEEAKDWSLISVQGGTLTITGEGKMLAKENDCYTVDVRNGANLVIESGEFVGNVHAIYVYEGSLTVNGGTFSVLQLYPDGINKGYEFTLNIYDANRQNGTATITVNGGSYYKFNPSNCYAEGEGTNFVAEGNIVEADGDYYVVLQG